MEAHAGALPAEGSFLSIEPPDSPVLVTALKPCEDGGGFALRLFNCSDREAGFKLTIASPIAEVWRADLMEKKSERLTTERSGGTTRLTHRLTGFEIETLVLQR